MDNCCFNSWLIKDYLRIRDDVLMLKDQVSSVKGLVREPCSADHHICCTTLTIRIREGFLCLWVWEVDLWLCWSCKQSARVYKTLKTKIKPTACWLAGNNSPLSPVESFRLQMTLYFFYLFTAFCLFFVYRSTECYLNTFPAGDISYKVFLFRQSYSFQQSCHTESKRKLSFAFATFRNTAQ